MTSQYQFYRSLDHWVEGEIREKSCLPEVLSEIEMTHKLKMFKKGKNKTIIAMKGILEVAYMKIGRIQ